MAKVWTAPVNERFNAKVRRGEVGEAERRGGVVLFWGGYLSQWYPAQFVIGGIKYSCAEQYMMACKAKVFGDEEGVANILSTPYPKAMKEVGRGVQGFDRRTWNGTGPDGRGGLARRVIFAGNFAKFSQNPDLRKRLLATGDAVIGEDSPEDDIYGIGFRRTHRGAWNPDEWTGWNWLGRCLMIVRETIRRGVRVVEGPVRVPVPASLLETVRPKVPKRAAKKLAVGKRKKHFGDVGDGAPILNTAGEVIYRSREGATSQRDIVREAAGKSRALRAADLRGADLHGLALFGAMLEGADLRKVDLRDADLNYAKLKGADLRGADLTGAKTLEADFRKADVTGAKGLKLHKRAIVRGVIGL